MLMDIFYLKVALISISLVLTTLLYLSQINISYLKPRTLLHNIATFIIESKYSLNFFARAYIFHLWLFCVGDDKNLMRRFKIINIFSTFLFL